MPKNCQPPSAFTKCQIQLIWHFKMPVGNRVPKENLLVMIDVYFFKTLSRRCLVNGFSSIVLYEYDPSNVAFLLYLIKALF